MEYIKIEANDKRIQSLQENGWELLSVRAGRDGNVYIIFRRPK